MKKFTKEELMNTYIENDQGKLRELYVNACIDAGYNHQSGFKTIDWYDLSLVGTCWSAWKIGQTSCISGNRAINKQLTLADFEEDQIKTSPLTKEDLLGTKLRYKGEVKMETKYKYTPVAMSPEEIYRAMLDGETFYVDEKEMYWNGTAFWLDCERVRYIDEDNDVCRREEIKWQDEVIKFLAKSTTHENDVELYDWTVGSAFITDKDFLEVARIALRATGELH